MSTQQVIPVPQLIIGRNVIYHMVKEAGEHPPTETGQALLGIERPGEIIVFGVIPDLLDTVREPGLFQQGGMDQVEIYRWLNDHWKAMRSKSRTPNQQTGWNYTVPIPKGTIPVELDNDLEHIGDWHKHPGRYTQLSGTDLGVIRRFLSAQDAPRDQILTPIITTSQASLDYSFNSGEMESNIVSGDRVHIVWYWTGRNSKQPVRLNPIIVSNDNLPWLPPLPWHLSNINRMRTELALLQQLGVDVRWTVKEMDDDPEMEVIFGLDHPSWKNQVVLITDWDYPHSVPKIKMFAKKDPAASTQAQHQKQQSSMIDSFWSSVQRWLAGSREPNIFEPRELVWRNRWDQNIYLVDILWDLDQKGHLLHVAAS